MSAQPSVLSWNLKPIRYLLFPSNSHSNLIWSVRTITIWLEKSLKSGKNFFILHQKTQTLSTEPLNRFIMSIKWSIICIKFLLKHPAETTLSWFRESITSKIQAISLRLSNTTLLLHRCIRTAKTIKKLIKLFSSNVIETPHFNTQIIHLVRT